MTGQVGRRSTSSGRAMQSSRIGAPVERSATCSTRSRNVSSPHWMSSNTTTSGRRSRQRARASCGTPRRSPRPRSTPRSRRGATRIAVAAASSAGSAVELLQHLDDGPVRDSLAVRQAATADDASPRRRERLGDEARLADAGVADDRDELAASLVDGRARHASRGSARARARGRRTACRGGARERRARASSR